MVTEEVNPALLLFVSGPAGSGKTTLCNTLQQALDPTLQRVITATTRPPREGEKNGVDYHFFDEDSFETRVKSGAFYEWAKVHDHRYGTLKSEIQGKLAQDIDLILSIDVQGAAFYREAAKEDPDLAQRLVTIFIQPLNLEQLKYRLRQRGDDDEDEIARRMKSAEHEIEQGQYFYHRIISGSRDEDFTSLHSIYKAEKQRLRTKER